MSFSSEDDLCEFSCSFVYHDEEESFQTFDPNSFNDSTKRQICIDEGVILEIPNDEVPQLRNQTIDKCAISELINMPSTSSQGPNFENGIVLGSGAKLILSPSKYQQLFEKLNSDVQSEAPVDEDKKSVSIDTDSDNESDDETRKKEESDSKKSKGSKGSKSEEKTTERDQNKTKPDKKRKSKKDSDVSTTESKESVKKTEPKKKKRRTKEPKKPKDQDESDEETNLIQKRKRALERQQIRRRQLNYKTKEKVNEKSKIKMRKIRSRKTHQEKLNEKKLNSERRFLQRSMKRSGLVYNSETIDINQHNFNCYQKSLQWVECSSCHKKIIQSSYKKFSCSKNCSLFTKMNDMDPLGVPEELSSLTYIEKQLISRIHPVISLYRVKKLQYKYRGQVINFTQDVQSVADSLPYLVKDMSHVVVVKLNDKVTLKDFVVRRKVVWDALVWLKCNNPHYFDIDINMPNLETLPENDTVYDELNIIHSEEVLKNNIPETDDDEDHRADEVNDEFDDIVFTSVPDSHDFPLLKSFSNEIVWPSIGKTPLNEFSSPGYISMAFPHLFCYGTSDYSMPRRQKVSLSEYIRHLMLYTDQRFAKDERFRYFIMNSEMRWNALNIGNVYVKRNSMFSNMTIYQLKEHFKENPWIVNQIMYFGSRLRTTKSYWKSRCSELLDMVDQLGTPTVFFTLSSADYHWPDLFRLMGHDVSTLSFHERAQILSQNPLIADSFFYLRSKFFLENSFTDHFDVKDMWFRYEFQHRGSIHLHGLAWFENAPVIKEFMTDTEKGNVLKYFDGLISCTNPDIHVLPSSTHPCQSSLETLTDMNKDLAHLVNQVQRHTKCTRNHCLRPIGRQKTLQCRYKFPKPLVSDTNFEFEDDRVVDINFQRNDGFVNKYNAWVLQTWRSNIDFSPILNKQIVYRYIAKYASKSEIKSINYNQVLTDIINKTCDDSEQSKKAIRKLLISSCGERDYSSQEVMHFLMGYHFHSSTREFIVVNLKNLDWTSVSYGTNGRSIFDLYTNRPLTYQKLSLFEFAKFVKVLKHVFSIRQKPAVVRFFPRVHIALDADILFTTLSVLFYPWRNIDDVSVIDDDMKAYVKLSYSKYISHVDFGSETDENNDFNEVTGVETGCCEKDNESILSSYNPNIKSNVDGEHNVNDDNVQWDYLSQKLNRETIHTVCEKLQIDVPFSNDNHIDYSTLNQDQLRVFNHIKSLTHDILRGTAIHHNFIIVQGMAGTGKTYLLKSCAQYIRLILGVKSIRLVALTGVAAKIINGSTIHSFLSLGRYHNHCERLKGPELMTFKEKNEGMKFLFVDEYSMVGLRLLACIENRCKDVSGLDNLFGGLTVVLFGDVNQLLPIGDQPLYADVDLLSQQNSLLERGKLLMSELTHAYVLEKCHRFANTEYVNFLRKVSKGTCTDIEFNFMKSRFVSSLHSDDRKKFKESIRICSTNESANEYNVRKLKDLKNPIAMIYAQNNNKTALSCSDDLADGLSNVLSLCIGCKVMLRRNINVSRGLVNGSIGNLKHIFYEKGFKPPAVPLCVLIHFESVETKDLNINYIPILPVLVQWYKKGMSCTRYQLPVSLCWACTIHKCQGLTLMTIVLDAGHSEFALGLLYVALSRVSDKNSLCLLTALSLDRLNSCRKSGRYKTRRKF